jgi:hypothetical protein
MGYVNGEEDKMEKILHTSRHQIQVAPSMAKKKWRSLLISQSQKLSGDFVLAHQIGMS